MLPAPSQVPLATYLTDIAHPIIESPIDFMW